MEKLRIYVSIIQIDIKYTNKNHIEFRHIAVS